VSRSKRAVIILALTLAGLLGGGVALADPDFGTGNSSKGPQDAGSVCSPSPNLDADLPQCK
jgi:hypothetical protein